MKIPFLGLLLGALFFSSCSATQKIKQQNNSAVEKAYIGTYTKKEGHVDGKAEGILYLEINKNTGEISNMKTVAEVINPSFVKLSPNGDFLFAVSELGPGDGEAGYIYSFRTLLDGELQQVSKLSTEAFAPAHIEVDKTGKFVFVSNYMGGVVMTFGVKADGSLERLQRIDLENPEISHAHSLTISPDNKMAYIADLGNDKIWIYKLDTEKGELIAAEQAYVEVEKGAGPRHFTISGNGEFAYVINELNSSITAFQIRENGSLQRIQNISSLPEDFSGKNSAADIWLHPSGKWLYASNRGHNSIAIFKVDEQKGTLQVQDFTSTEGKTPRGFAVSSDGTRLYVGNQDSGSISVFSIGEDGNLTLMKEPSAVPTPVRIELIE